MNIGTILAVLVIGGLVIYGLSQGSFTTKTITTPSGPSGGSGGIVVQTSGATIRATAYNGLNATLVTNDDAILFAPDGVTRIANDVNINAAPTSITTAAPNSCTGCKLLLKNDAALVANSLSVMTDRGGQYYGTVVPVESSVGSGSYNSVTTLDLPKAAVYAIGAPTFTTIDNGAIEAGTAFSVDIGSGITVDTTTIKFSVSSGAAIGNPNFNNENPIAVCFNTTAAGSSFLKDVRPLTNAGSFPSPIFYSKLNIINGVCWKLPTKAVVDDPTGNLGNTITSFDLRIQAQPGQNPTPSHNVTMMILTKDYYIGDNGGLAVGYGQDTVRVASQPIGFNPTSSANSLLIGIS